MKEVTIERITVPWYMQYILVVLKEKDTHRRIPIGDFMLREKIKKIYRKGSTKSGKPKMRMLDYGVSVSWGFETFHNYGK